MAPRVSILLLSICCLSLSACNKASEPGADSEMTRTLLQSGIDSFENGMYMEAERKLKKAEQNAYSTRDDVSVAEASDALGDVYVAEYQYDIAIPYYRKAVELFRKQPDGDTKFGARWIDSLDKLAALYDQTAKHTEAVRTYEEVVLADDKLKVRPWKQQVSTLKNMAEAAQDARDAPSCIKAMERALLLDQQKLGETHPEVAADYLNLGRYYKFAKRPKDAEHYLLKALDIKNKNVSSKDDRSQYTVAVRVYEELAKLYHSQSDEKRREEALRKCLAAGEKAYGKNNQDLIKILRELKETLLAQKRDNEASEINNRIAKLKGLPPF